MKKHALDLLNSKLLQNPTPFTKNHVSLCFRDLQFFLIGFFYFSGRPIIVDRRNVNRMVGRQSEKRRRNRHRSMRFLFVEIIGSGPIAFRRGSFQIGKFSKLKIF